MRFRCYPEDDPDFVFGLKRMNTETGAWWPAEYAFTWKSAAIHCIFVLLHTGAVIRIGIVLVFISSVAFAPVRNAILLVASRLVESDKPIFTILFAAVGAMIKAGREIASIF
jgi:hypothetical protein